MVNFVESLALAHHDDKSMGMMVLNSLNNIFYWTKKTDKTQINVKINSCEQVKGVKHVVLCRLLIEKEEKYINVQINNEIIILGTQEQCRLALKHVERFIDKMGKMLSTKSKRQRKQPKYAWKIPIPRNVWYGKTDTVCFKKYTLSRFQRIHAETPVLARFIF